MKRGHRERIIAMLRSNPIGVCATSFLAAYMPTYSQRIGELKVKGWVIVTERCTQHDHDSKQIQYRLVKEPDPQTNWNI